MMKLAACVLICLCTVATISATVRVVDTTASSANDKAGLASTPGTSLHQQLEHGFHSRTLRSRPNNDAHTPPSHRLSGGSPNAPAAGRRNGRHQRIRRSRAGRRPFRPRISLPRQHKRFHTSGPAGSRQQGGKRYSLSLQQADVGPIRYRGGRVVTGSGSPPAVQVYLLYYGNWTDDGQRNILENFVSSLSASEGTLASWWNTSAPYYQLSGDGNASFVASEVSPAGMHCRASEWRLAGGWMLESESL